MRHLPGFTFVFLALLAACSTATDDDAASTVSALAAADVEIDVSPSRGEAIVDERIFGTNFLYWVENDAALQDGRIRTALANAGVKMLRFPGGAVANNYDWKTNSLDDPSIFPRSPHPLTDPVKRTDYVEFLDFMSGVPHAEANFVVNIEGAYRASPPSQSRFLQRAADWVKDANVVHHRGVRYWEIGNEEYFPRRYGFTAHDYAAEVVAYANAMKAVDPTVRIGAVGPFSATEGSFIDRLTPNGREKFRSMTDDELDAKKKELGGADELADWLNDGVTVTPRAWWDVVAESAGAQLDFIVLHRYDGTRATGDFSKPVQIAETVDAIRNVVAKHKSGAFEVAMTEYNVANEAELSPNEYCAAMVEQMMHLMRSHVSFANFWPLRLGQSPSSLMTISGDPKAQLDVFGDIATHVGHVLLPSTLTKGSDVDVVSTADWRTATTDVRRTVIVLNRKRSTRSAHIAHLPGKVARAVQYHGDDAGNGALEKAVLSPRTPSGTNDVYFKLRPLSITVLTMIGND